jgi:hypothetical protein
MDGKLAILHFNIIEKYPPVMNFIFDALEDNPNQKIIVFTTNNTTSYTTPHFPNTKIYRIGTISTNPFIRFTSYVWFNLLSSFVLLLNRFDEITVFETISIFPLWLVSKTSKRKKGHIHYHEYISQPERIESSTYMKILFKIEDHLLKKYSCSQTNVDRKQLFLQDKPFLKSEMVEVRPNMPPKSWWTKYGQFKKKRTDEKIKLLYLGAFDNQTMYVKEVLDWVTANKEQLELTIISQQLGDQTKDLIATYGTTAIKVIKPIDYYELPKELVKYHVGLVLYKGHIPNYVYNVPNKVFEYLACGLDVLTSNQLTSTIELKNEKIIAVDFSKLNKIVLQEYLDNF